MDQLNLNSRSSLMKMIQKFRKCVGSNALMASYFKATPANPSFDTPHLFAVDPKGMIVHDWGQASADDPGLAKELRMLIRKVSA